MTEYEAYDTIMSITANSFNLMFGYFSLIFGFLVMSHLAANRIPGRLVPVVIGLFSLATLAIVVSFYALNVDLDSLYEHMLEQKWAGEYDLNWFGNNPLWVPQSLSIFQTLLGFGAYFGSLFFFFHSRKNHTSG